MSLRDPRPVTCYTPLSSRLIAALAIAVFIPAVLTGSASRWWRRMQEVGRNGGAE